MLKQIHKVGGSRLYQQLDQTLTFIHYQTVHSFKPFQFAFKQSKTRNSAKMKFSIVLAALFAAMAYAAPSGVSGNILGGDSSNDDNAVVSQAKAICRQLANLVLRTTARMTPQWPHASARHWASLAATTAIAALTSALALSASASKQFFISFRV